VNEPVKDGDYVVILKDNYGSSRIPLGSICRCVSYGDLMYVKIRGFVPNTIMMDDLGYYSYRKLDTPLLRLVDPLR